LSDMVKNLMIWVAIAALLVSLFQNFRTHDVQSRPSTYSEFIDEVQQGSISKVVSDPRKCQLQVSRKDGTGYVINLPTRDDPNLLEKLLDRNIIVEGAPLEGQSLLATLFISWFPMLLLIGVWVFFIRQMQGGGKGAISFGKSRARMLNDDQIKTTFADVAGCDEAKEEVSELVEYLREPARFQKLGGKIPKGVLMFGPPGTGKTLLAKAIAGEAKVPFFSMSGSDFVEMFVGVGASRVRDLFEQAKKAAPCIIFIDEIDAVGGQRGGGGLGGGHSEREQTLNQMLVEMDGFEGTESVIVIAATNRPDVLDPALLRPGRFDRQVVVGLPDIRGREQILKVHMNRIPLASDVNAFVIARGTPGFSGADLANLVNEAALWAARSNQQTVSMAEFEKARDKMIMGVERRSRVMSEAEKESTAYHEAGHAIVGYLSPNHDPVYKVTIIPRGQALGLTMYLPEKDQFCHSKQYFESSLSTIYGGRIAEALIYGNDHISNGATSDIQHATSIARQMMTVWGFSEKLGPILYAEMAKAKRLSDETERAIDSEIRAVIDCNYQRAVDILENNRDILEAMKDALMKYETIGAIQIDDLMARRAVRPPVGWEEEPTELTHQPPPHNTSTASSIASEMFKQQP
jgi:cell division protease FtsH